MIKFAKYSEIKSNMNVKNDEIIVCLYYTLAKKKFKFYH